MTGPNLPRRPVCGALANRPGKRRGSPGRGRFNTSRVKKSMTVADWDVSMTAFNAARRHP